MGSTEMISSDLLLAVWDGRTSSVKDLLDAGVDVNSRESGDGETASVTALMLAVMRGYVDVVKTLLDKGADVSAQDHFGYTALMFAIELSNKQIIELLKNAGAVY